jgi:hypothetical protein
MVNMIFVSYSSKDQYVADAIVNTLESKKIKCWIAYRDADPGDKYAASIMRAIKNSKICVLVFSDQSNRSEHILNEINACVNNGVIIIPFRITDTKMDEALEYYLGKTHWLDALTKPLENHITKLEERIVNILQLKPAEIKQEEPIRPKIKTNKKLTLIAAGILIIFVVALFFMLTIKSQDYYSDFETITQYLSKTKGSIEQPINLPVKISLGDMTDPDSGWQELLRIIESSEKYVALDLLACSMESDVFDPVESFSLGKKYIVSLILPKKAKKIVDGSPVYADNIIEDGNTVHRFIARYSIPFLYFENLKTIRGDYITHIGEMSFFNIQSIENIHFPIVTDIGNTAFINCIGLKSINFPSLVNIGHYAFSGCINLVSATFPSTTNFVIMDMMENPLIPDVSVISNIPVVNPFIKCPNLVSFNLTGAGLLVTSQDGKALIRKRLDQVENLPSGMQYGYDLISYPSASGDIYMDDITGISFFALKDCDTINSVNFPKVLNVGISAFADTNIKNANLPIATKIDANNFNDSLISITVARNCEIDTTNSKERMIKFKEYYNNPRGGNKQAGTYKWEEDKWTGPVN